MLLIGAVKVFKAYGNYFAGEALTGTAPMSGVNQSIALLAQAIDSFLIALVLMIFSSAIYSLFVNPEAAEKSNAPQLFKIQSITALKKTLAEMIVIILMVKFLESALLDSKNFGWEALVLPAAILLLAAAVRVLNLER